jgi:hypothetical protein
VLVCTGFRLPRHGRLRRPAGRTRVIRGDSFLL